MILDFGMRRGEYMEDEIKEILDRLERIDHKEYSGGFEFADSGSFDEMARCFKERKKLANYITNLQEENERLKNHIQMIPYLQTVKEKEYYKLRIEKAIEYIKEYCIDDEFYVNLTKKEKNIIEILNILKGEE